MKQLVYDIVDKNTGEKYNCIPQMVDINFNGNYSLRYNIGIEGYHEWSFLFAIYSDSVFNMRFRVVGVHESIRVC